MHTNKTIEIGLFDKTYKLSQRTARDVNKMIEFSRQNKEKDYKQVIIEQAIVVEDSLKINYVNIPDYSFWERLFNHIKRKEYRNKLAMQKVLSRENILNQCSPEYIFEVASKVYELEGVDKKKVQAVLANE